MSFKFYCIHCGQRISATAEDQGTPATCPDCERTITVPRVEDGELVVAPAGLPPKVLPSARGRNTPLIVGIMIGLVAVIGVATLLMLQQGAQFGRDRDGTSAQEPGNETPAKSNSGEKVEPPIPVEQPPPETNQVMGGSRLTVDALLAGWPAETGRRLPPDKQIVI
ncbi:MAG: hypothetical protein ABI680_12365, partial [Chthoniobacteraceae bacterium]